MTRSPQRWLGLLACLGVGVNIGLASGLFLSRAGALPHPAQAAAPAPSAPAGTEEAAYDQLARQYEAFRQVDRTFEQVARVVSPAVVHIVARKRGEDEGGRSSRFEETGSGVIVRADDTETRYVLTNNHVVDGALAEEVTVHLHDGRVLKPTLFWADFKVDIAVLKLDRTDLPAARLGNSDEATVGSWVLAIGSPFGLNHSVSQGIISARSRYEQELEDDGVENQDFLQTDAAINPGNSGGPLVNLKGEVIGINTAIASNGGGSEGVGFSIPINLARWAMTQLVKTGRVSRGAIGVRLVELDPRGASDLGLDRPRGARIDQIQPDSPAALAGLKSNDVILRFNGTDVLDFNHLINLVSMSDIGREVEMLVWRERRAIPLKIIVADRAAVVAEAGDPAQRVAPNGLLRRPNPPTLPDAYPSTNASRTGSLGLFAIAGALEARRFGLPEAARGVLITRLDPSSPFASQLRVSDLVESIDGRPVEAVEELRKALEPSVPAELVILRPAGSGFERYTVRIGR